MEQKPSLFNYNRLSATIHRLHLNNGDRQPVKTLTMRDPTGGFGALAYWPRLMEHYFAYNTLRQLSELYLLQGLH